MPRGKIGTGEQQEARSEGRPRYRSSDSARGESEGPCASRFPDNPFVAGCHTPGPCSPEPRSTAPLGCSPCSTVTIFMICDIFVHGCKPCCGQIAAWQD